jgi:two-component sensor histidine kinase
LRNQPTALTPVVEQPPHGDSVPEISARALQLRVRQQEILAKLGVMALQGIPFPALVNETVKLTAEGLEAEFCKVMEYLPGENALLVRAGVGWDANIVGVARVGADLESPAGYALRTGKPVISNHLGEDDRFRTPGLLQRHGVHRAINVILQGERAAYGVLEVDSRAEGEFTEQDIAFLQGAANILGMAIERHRIETELRGALDKHRMLLDELNHRVKNSLQIVVTMLRMQADRADANAKQHLIEAGTRVAAIGRAHEHLYGGVSVEKIDLGRYLIDLSADLTRSISPCKVTVSAEEEIMVAPDRAIPIALIVTELATNAFKYAYPEKSPDCRIALDVKHDGPGLAVTVRDWGRGLPPDSTAGDGLGLRIINGLTKQLGGDLTSSGADPGTIFVLRLGAQGNASPD